MSKKILSLFRGACVLLVLSGLAAAAEISDRAVRVAAETDKKLAQAAKLTRGHYYDEALALIKTIPLAPGEITHEERVLNRLRETEKAKSKLALYKGPVHHVFFHSLIIYPELAFDKRGHPANGYNMWMTTVSEFKKMLPEFLERGYILYSLADLIEPDESAPETIKRRKIFLPPGKIPLVISIDDVNYYEYMKTDGFAERLVMSGDIVCTQVITPEGNTVVTRDGDVMPILDEFVERNPEFSWRGAKGVLALTGYQGALGYRIKPEFPPEQNAEATRKAKIVADALKKNGWLFACHSYGHSQFFRNGSINLGKFQTDTEKWIKYIEPITGKTNIYISPFGVSIIFKNSIYNKYLLENGFNIFCPVGGSTTLQNKKEFIVMSRANLDGFKMNTAKKFLNDNYFDVDATIDPMRPKLEMPK